MDTPHTPTQSRMVRFATMSQMIYIHKDPKHDAACWYTSDDELNFKLDARDEMASYLHGTGTRMIPFGMEHLQSRKYAQKQAMMKRLVQFVVLSEQTRHIPHEHPYDKQDRIAIASMKHSKWSRDEARAIGIHQQRSRA